MRGCRGLTGVGLSSGRRCIIGRVRARLVLSVQVLVPSSARGESRTLTGLPPGDFEFATYRDDWGIAGSYGDFRGAVLPGGFPSRLSFCHLFAKAGRRPYAFFP